jgi:succinyl-CoA synthetase beta subunit
MKIHEYQAKAVLAKHGVPVPRGEVAFTPQEVPDIARRLGTSVTVVKAQIHAGGRGKAGGVKLAKSSHEAEQIARELIGKTLVTYQTGPDGQRVSRLLVEEGLAIDRELYLGLVLDRSTQRIVLMVSQEGGVEIEKIAAEQPEKIHKVFINPAVGLQAFEAQRLGFALGLSGDSLKKGVRMMLLLYNTFIATDASIVEINPLIVTKAGDLLALDAKMNFDDNALYRHADIRELRDISEEDPLEVEASKFSLNYIRLDGTIGCMLINIFGGILRNDVLAAGVIAAVKELGVAVPIVIRMKGTNVEEGKKMLAESGLNFTTADTMGEAADKVVALSRGR